MLVRSPWKTRAVPERLKKCIYDKALYRHLSGNLYPHKTRGKYLKANSSEKNQIAKTIRAV